MKKAVINTGGKQYLVSEGDKIEVELLKDAKEKVTFEALLVVDSDKTIIGTPFVDKVKVNATIEKANAPQDKVTSIRYKAKKRVHTVRGHRQRLTNIKITSIG